MSSLMRIFNFRFAFKYSSALYLSKWSLILLNICFILTAIVTASIIWVNVEDEYRPLFNETISSPEKLQTMIATKKCGVTLTSTIITLVSLIGVLGAAIKSIKVILFYDILIGLTLVLLLFGWQNYQHIRYIYLAVLASMLTSLILSLAYIKVIRREPIRIRKQLLLNHVNTRESFIF